MIHVAFRPPQGAGRWWLAVLWLLAVPALAAEATAPAWREWSPRIFEQARRESRLVLLDVVAEWCRLCRKMDLATYRDAKVLDAIRRHYVPVRADVDRVAEIKRRYGAYGVPAVVIFNADGMEIIKRRGYLEPEWLYWMLITVAGDPDPAAHR